jgi:hypothetical protein
MGKMTNSNLVEIPGINFNRAKEFYSRIYDYEMYEETIGAFGMGFLPMDRKSAFETIVKPFHSEFISESDNQCIEILKPRLPSERAGSSGRQN